MVLLGLKGLRMSTAIVALKEVWPSCHLLAVPTTTWKSVTYNWVITITLLISQS